MFSQPAFHRLRMHLQPFRTSVRKLPLLDGILIHEAVDGITEVSLPGVAPQLAITQDGHPDLSLTIEDATDGSILDLT
jgi:hypothetical protein